MKSIFDYKRDIVALLKELEQEHCCKVNSVDIAFEYEDVAGVSMEHIRFNINIS